MGRYRRKDKRYNNSSKDKFSKFNSLDVDLLESYLQYYHHSANKVCFPPSPNEYDSDDDDETIRMSNRQNRAFETDITWIGGHAFPALTQEILEQPYLALPNTLGTRERRTVYELCIHVGLYHTGAGIKFKNRYSVISLHPDGLEHCHEILKPISFPTVRCKPWFYRNDIGIPPTPRKGMKLSSSYLFSPHFLSRHKVRDITRKTKAVIEDLMAYPYQCIREEFESVESLSELPPFEEIKGTQNTVIVTTAEQMQECAEALSNPEITEIGFDVEAYNASKYHQATCLIQLYTNIGTEYVIDVLAEGVWDQVSKLQPIFGDANVVKVGHGISGVDVPCLHRDFGIFIVNAFDTYEAATVLHLKTAKGLAKLCEYYKLPEDVERYMHLKKLYQNCDWRERPMENDQIEYSIMDVRYLLQLRKCLIKDMLESDTVPPMVTNVYSQMVSPLKVEDKPNLERDISTNTNISTNEFSVIGGIDSMDVDDEHNQNGKMYNLAADSNYEDFNGNNINNDNEDDEDDDDDELEEDDFVYRGGSEHNFGYDTLQMKPSKSGEEDDKSFFTAHDDNDGKSQSTIGSKVSELRYNQILMDALKISQQRCLLLWTEKKEPSDKNDMLMQMMRRAERLAGSGNENVKVWTKEDYWLYKELVEWREDVAKKIGIMPSMLCPLNLLVNVAYKRPSALINLKRLNYFLPDIFNHEEHSHHLEDLFSVVAGAGAENDTLINTDAIVRLYSERKIRRKTTPSTTEFETAKDKPNLDIEEMNEDDTQTQDEEGSIETNSIIGRVIDISTGPKFYHKLTLTVTVATIAVVAVNLIKRKK